MQEIRKGDQVIVRKRNRLIFCLVLYSVVIIAYTIYYVDSIKKPPLPPQELPDNFLKSLGSLAREISEGVSESIGEIFAYFRVILAFSCILYLTAWLFVKKIRLIYLFLCPIVSAGLSYAIFELIRSFPGFGTGRETDAEFYFSFAVACILSAFLVLRFVYRELFKLKQNHILQPVSDLS